MNVITANSKPLAKMPRPAVLLLDLLHAVRGGRLDIALPDGSKFCIDDGGALHASMQVHDWRMFEQVLWRSDIGFGDSYTAGQWDSPDPAALLHLLTVNGANLAHAVNGRFLGLLVHRLTQALRVNTRRGSRRNIMAHYDLGNDFYSAWLDPSMTYSAACFESDTQDLVQAQQAKYRRILECLDAQPGQHILEIGCGWGGFAEFAAQEYGCKVTGITVSPAQLEYARRRSQRGGFADKADFLLCDYRDMHGSFDHIVSIEMFEAVGERYWPAYFAKLNRLLKPAGKVMIQTITIHDDLFASYRRGTDFIRSRIFPGGSLPAPKLFHERAQRNGFEVIDDYAFGADYTRTLRIWEQRFMSQQNYIQDLGFDERFIRLWRFYLAYCQAGFMAGNIDVRQFTLQTRS